MGKKENRVSHLHLIFILIYYMFSCSKQWKAVIWLWYFLGFSRLPVEDKLIFFFFAPSRPVIGPALPPGFRRPSQDTGNSRCSIGPSVSSEFHNQVWKQKPFVLIQAISRSLKKSTRHTSQ